MTMLPYIASISSWRCEFHPIGKPEQALFRYSSASAWRYLMDHGKKRERVDISPKGLGKAIIRNADPALVRLCAGEVSERMEGMAGAARSLSEPAVVGAATRLVVHRHGGVKNMVRRMKNSSRSWEILENTVVFILPFFSRLSLLNR
jgi:hypothetical protein